jgi:hypothetical protein
MTRNRPKLFWVALLIASICVGALTFAASRPRRLPKGDERKPNPIRVSPSPGINEMSRALDPVQNIRFTLYDEGILPREVQATKGLVSFAIEDRTRKSEGLVIEREVGNVRVAIGQVKRFQNVWRGRGQVRLVPGRYTIFDSSRPQNRARIVVAP